jgi:hypothetical protein
MALFDIAAPDEDYLKQKRSDKHPANMERESVACGGWDAISGL